MAVSASGLRENKGSFETEEQALAAVVHRLIQHLDPEAIYLFGSRVRDEARPDSDFDLLVVTRTEDRSAADYDHAYAPLLGFGVGCDVIPCPKDEFDAERDRPTSLCYEAFHRGRRLYERC